MTMMLVLSFAVFQAPHMSHPDTPHDPLPTAMMIDGSAPDLEREDSILHALYGHNYAGHAASHGAALPVLPDLAVRLDVTSETWLLIEDQRRTSHGAPTLRRPPRA